MEQLSQPTTTVQFKPWNKFEMESTLYTDPACSDEKEGAKME
jgi:hypothetical protein